METFTLDDIKRRGHPVWAEVDLGALGHNIRALRARAAPAEVMAVVKGYAYGHGNPRSAQAMLDAGATRLGVARVAEAIHLREAGIDAPIHVFSEPPPEGARAVVELGLTASVYTSAFAEVLSRAAASLGTSVGVHVKIDTGMHRVGLPVAEAVPAAARFAALPGIRIEGAWSHLAVADQPQHDFNRRQLDTFTSTVEKVEGEIGALRYKHLANSAATLWLDDAHLDLVRCGVASYGLWPAEELRGSVDLRPALALRARINMAKQVAAGDALSYGLHYELRDSGRVVTIPGGYADGYDRRLSGRADVLIRGERHRVSGTVCMDQFMVDVHEHDIEVGEIATLLGADGRDVVSAEELAALVGTINYEITSRIASRVPRVYVDRSPP